MKHYPQIIADLLKIIARQERDLLRQERELLFREKTIARQVVEIQALKDNLKETQKAASLFSEFSKHSFSSSEKIADMIEMIKDIIKQKPKNNGGNPYPPSMN